MSIGFFLYTRLTFIFSSQVFGTVLEKSDDESDNQPTTTTLQLLRQQRTQKSAAAAAAAEEAAEMLCTGLDSRKFIYSV